jgi:hypothetical protein
MADINNASQIIILDFATGETHIVNYDKKDFEIVDDLFEYLEDNKMISNRSQCQWMENKDFKDINFITINKSDEQHT